jgi:hypothetical protein
MGTGAFSSVSAQRQVKIKTANDGNALLGLAPSDSPNGQYATTESGEVVIDLNQLDGTNDGGGSGLNQNSETTIGSIVTVTNQGTQPVVPFVPAQSRSADPNNFGVSDRVHPDPDGDGTKEYAKPGNGNVDGDDGSPNDIYLDVVTPAGGGKSLTGIYGVYDPSDSWFDDMQLGVGDSLEIGLTIRVKNAPDSLNVSIPISADTDAV